MSVQIGFIHYDLLIFFKSFKSIDLFPSLSPCDINYLLKKQDQIACRIFHSLDFVDCIPAVYLTYSLSVVYISYTWVFGS